MAPMTLVLLDRDGVINFDSENYIRSPEEWKPIPGSIKAIARLKRAGFKVVVCTNQSGIARGYYTACALSQIHSKMHTLLSAYSVKLDKVYYCPHAPGDGCDCRKPAPGMLLKALSDFPSPKAKTWFIGDSTRDMQAAIAANCQPILVRTGNGAMNEEPVRALGINEIHDNLESATDWLLGADKPHQQN